MMDNPAAVVLAGIHDWGSCVLNKAIVRPLAPLANRAVVEHVLDALKRAGVKRVAICCNGHAREMRAALGGNTVAGMHIVYRDESMPRGPAGCIKDAAAELGANEFVVAEATVVPHFDVAELIRSHRDSRACLTIATKQTLLGNERTHEPVGVYVCSRQIMSYINDRGYQDLKEGVVPKLHAAGLRVDVHAIDGAAPRLFGIGSYFAVNEWATKRACAGDWEMDGYAIEGTALVHIDARIHRSVRLLGPVIVGPGSELREGAIVVGPSTIAADCVVGEGAAVSRSALWTGSVVGDRAHVDRSIVACNAHIEPDTKHYSTVSLPGQSMDRKGPKHSHGVALTRHADARSPRPRTVGR